MKKIIIVTRSLDFGGGAERNCINLVNFLLKQYKVEVIVISGKENKLIEELSEKIKIKYLKCKGKKDIFFKLRDIKLYLNAECIISFDPLASCFLNILKKSNFIKIKLISRCMNTLSEQGKFQNRLWIKRYFRELLYRKIYGLSDYIVAQSIDMEKDLIKNYKIDSKKIIRISNTIDFNKIEELKKEKILIQEREYFAKKTIISVGRLIKQKNHMFLIEVMKEIRNRGKEINLVILGEGNERGKLEKKIKEYHLEDRIFLLGLKKNPYIYIQKADFLWLPSFYEGFPNVLLDAIVCGTVIISNDCKSGPREIISQERVMRQDKKKYIEEYDYGYLYEVGNFYKNKIKFLEELEKILFNNEEKNQKISRNYDRLVKKYFIEEQLSKYISLIEGEKENGK